MSTAQPAASLPRLLAGLADGPLNTLGRHLQVHGAFPQAGVLTGTDVLALAEACKLRGRGGGGFPVAHKLKAVRAARGKPIVVANGCEGEPLSGKDDLLLRELPHLVLDGAALAARAVGAQRIIIAAKPSTIEDAGLERVLAERRAAGIDEPGCELFAAADAWLSGQETALVSQINGGPPRPSFAPPRPSDRGVRGRPTLVQNVETLAHIALIARHGADWYRGLGTAVEPGSSLVTVTGAGGGRTIYEIAYGTPLRDVLAAAGALDAPIAGLLVGGYFGSWLPPRRLDSLRLERATLAQQGASLGCGVLVALPASACPVAETVRVAGYLASQSAGQCGPCVNGTAAIARRLEAISQGVASQSAFADVRRWTIEIADRGACHHPNGFGHFIATAVQTFLDQFDDHARHGPCAACSGAPVLTTPLEAYR